MDINWIEGIGLIAASIIAVSMLMNKLFSLRIINSIGAALFIYYGFLIGSISVVVLNGFIFLINLYHLLRTRIRPEILELSETLHADHLWFLRFWTHYKKDIHHFFPQINPKEWVEPKILFVLRNTLPVNLIVLQAYRQEGWEILVDYVIPEYRDYRNGLFFFKYGIKNLPFTKGKELVVFSRNRVHKKYLEKMGFHSTDQIGDLSKFIYHGSIE